jgi:DNA repair exonuclease SbcCD nuclease subunit
MPVTLVWRTDAHLSDDTPQSRTDDWPTTVLTKLAHVGVIARRVHAHAVIDGGDFFSIKSPVRNSHNLVRRAIEVHRAYPCEVYVVPGNHDCVYGDYSYLPQQPLGVLYEAGTFQRLYDDHEAVFTARGENRLMPQMKVRVVGVPYHGVNYDLSRLKEIVKGDEDYLVVAAHLLASPTHSTMFESEDVLRYDLLDAYPDVDVWCFGHWHKDQGITRTPAGTPVVNVGSLTRGALSQDNLDRVPSVVVMQFGFEGVTLERVPVLHTSSEVVFDLVARDKDVIQQNMIEEFVEHLSATFTPSAQKSLTDAVRELPGVPDAVRESTIGYIEKAGGR